MKLTITTGTLRSCPCVRAQAIMPKSKKLGVPKRLSKTWSFTTVALEFTSAEIRPMVEAEAKRWEANQMARFAREKKLSEAAAKANDKLKCGSEHQPVSGAETPLLIL